MSYYDERNVSDHSSDAEDDGLWEKPAWAKGGLKLRSTGKANAMKADGNLAAPITFTPYKSNDHNNYVANPQKLSPTSEGEKMKTAGNLAQPITFIREELKKQNKRGSGRL
jgi:hypothetical protein